MRVHSRSKKYMWRNAAEAPVLVHAPDQRVVDDRGPYGVERSAHLIEQQPMRLAACGDRLVHRVRHAQEAVLDPVVHVVQKAGARHQLDRRGFPRRDRVTHVPQLRDDVPEAAPFGGELGAQRRKFTSGHRRSYVGAV